MIEREPFLIRHMVRISAVMVAAGLIALVIFGVRFQMENAEHTSATQGASHQYRSRPPTASELANSCEFFGGVYLGAPAKTVGTVGLLESCNLVGTAAQRIQCEFFSGTWRKSDCSVDVTAALQAQSSSPSDASVTDAYSPGVSGAEAGTLEGSDALFGHEQGPLAHRDLNDVVLSGSRLPPPVRLERVVLVSMDPHKNKSLRDFLHSSDVLLKTLDPIVSYLGILAAQALRNDVSRLRVVTESGGMEDALRLAPPLSRSGELEESAYLYKYKVLVKALMAAGLSGQSAMLRALTSQRAVTEPLQVAVESRAIGRFFDLLAAFETAVEHRNDLAQRKE